MSMNLQIKRGAEADLRREAKDGFAASDLRRHAMKAGGASELRKAIAGIDLSDAAIDRHLAGAGEEARKQGFFSRLLFGAAKDSMREEMRAGRKLLDAQKRQLDAMAADDQFTDDVEAQDAILDLHKSWHVLHYLFTGSASEVATPAGALLSGGAETGRDTGYGRARILNPKETAAFARFLETASLDDLKARLDLEALAENDIYGAPLGDSEDPDIDLVELEEEIETYFPMLRDYVKAAAEKGEAVAVWMS
jgi:hypothetical protein